MANILLHQRLWSSLIKNARVVFLLIENVCCIKLNETYLKSVLNGMLFIFKKVDYILLSLDFKDVCSYDDLERRQKCIL